MSALSVVDVLERAADLIEPEGRWTQGEYARDIRGCKVSPVSAAREPACFCMLGAVMHAAGTSRQDSKPMQFLEDNGGRGGEHWRWNDREGRTQAEVVTKLREAAALARDQANNP